MKNQVKLTNQILYANLNTLSKNPGHVPVYNVSSHGTIKYN